MTKKILMLMLMLVTAPAYGECIMRSSSTLKVVGTIDGITEIKPLASISPDNKYLCTISAKVLYHGKWETIYSSYTGDPAIGIDEICVNAVELGVRQFLADKEARKFVSEQQMVCSDETITAQRPVRVGEIIQESEVLPDPAHPGTFQYKGTTCRRFVETSAAPENPSELYQWHGVICKTGRKNANEWSVADKF